MAWKTASKPICWILSGACLAGLLGLAVAASSAAERTGMTAVPQTTAVRRGARHSFACTDTPVSEVIRTLRHGLKVNIVLDPMAVRHSERPVTLHLRDVSVREALQTITFRTGLTYLIRNDVIWVTTPAVARRQAVTDLRIYNVRDFSTSPAVALGSAVTGQISTGIWSQGSTGTGQTTGQQNRASALAALLTLIIEVTGPENWGTVSILGPVGTGTETLGLRGDAF